MKKVRPCRSKRFLKIDPNASKNGQTAAYYNRLIWLTDSPYNRMQSGSNTILRLRRVLTKEESLFGEL